MNYLLSAYGLILLVIYSYVIRLNIKCGSLAKKASDINCEPTSLSWLNGSGTRLGLVGLSFFVMMVALYMALIWSPDAVGEPVTYRILYFHVASAFMSYIGFFITFVGSILFLKKKDLKFDRWAKVGADLGVHFCALMIISGMIWGKQRWGAWWTWEPRLTTALILLVIYVGYLVLRHVMENPNTTARYAAVYGIIGFIDVPIVHYAIKFSRNRMHPAVTGGGENSGLAPEMMLTLEVSIAAFLVTFLVMYLIRFKVDCFETDIARNQAAAEDS